jgi:predicted permease
VKRSHDDADDEIRHHILERADLLVRAGWSRRDALREAERRFGDVERIRREMTAPRRFGAIELFRSIGSDVRYAVRAIRNGPGFALAVVATLALGIGAVTSIFAVIDALLLRPLPYRAAERLVEVNHAAWQSGGYTPGNTTSRVREWRQSGSEFADGWVAWSPGALVRTDGGATEELSIVAVTPGADTLLGIPLRVGRAFTTDDARPGSPDVAILGRAYFDRLGADRSIVGRTLRLDGRPVTVVGVLHGGIRFPTWGGDADLWIPIRDDFTAADRPLSSVDGLWARLRPGISLAAAQQRADVIAGALQEHEPLDGGWDVQLVGVGAHRVDAGVKRALLMLSATVAAILLIAWINAANLMLVRTMARNREFAVRLAIGGSGPRLLRQLVIEGLVWGVAGGLAALALAVITFDTIRGMVPRLIVWSSPHAVEMESRTLTTAFVASLVVGIGLGLVPAIQVTRDHRLSPLARRSSDDGLERRRLRRGLVVGQIALSMTLLAAAGLFVKSFARLVHVDPGYEYERIAVAHIGLSPARYGTAAAHEDFFRRLEEMLEARPEVVAVTRIQRRFRSGVALETEDGRPHRNQPYRVPSAAVRPDYFDVMGVELIAGRPFEAADVGTEAVIIDLDLARFLWGEAARRALGQRFRLGEDGDWLNVVGIVHELRLMGRDQREGPHQILYPASPEQMGSVELGVRATGDPRTVLGPIRDAIRQLDPDQTIWRLRTASDALAEFEEEPRFIVRLMSLLAALAVSLAAVGLYGVISFTVARRQRELAVRVALGSDTRRLREMVLRDGLSTTMLGVALGLLGTVVVGRAIGRLLYEVPPNDPMTFAITTALFVIVATGATLVPAYRATRVSPAEALRSE